MKKQFFLLLIILVCSTSCSRFYNISKNEIAEEYEEDSRIKVVLKDSTEKVFEKSELIFKSADTAFVIVEDGYETFLKFNEIDKIYVKEIDEVKTLFASAWIGYGIACVLILLLYAGIVIFG